MRTYIPTELPLTNLDFQRLLGVVGKANAELARYDGLLSGIVNPAVLLSPLTTQEAVLSSRIEGTQATLDEVFELEAGMQKTEVIVLDIHEIQNYRKALMLGADYLLDMPISLPLIRQMHKVLLDSVRGEDKTPGHFRKDQNWIGSQGTPIEEATFVPPNPFIVEEYLNKWIQYIRASDIDDLIQLAIVHAQFELIHPFNDGNGRIGRLLIPLFLYYKKVLSSPMFYLSAYLERHRDEYYESLRIISDKGDWNQWIEFFLNGVKVQAMHNSNKVRDIMNLYEKMKTVIQDITHSQYSFKIIDAMFDKPIFSTTDFIKRTEISKQSASKFLTALKDRELIAVMEEASGRRPAVYIFRELINIAEGKTVI